MPAASELPMYSSIASRSWLRKGVELSIERGGSREQVDRAVIGPVRWSGGHCCLAEDLAKIMVGWWNPCQVWSGTSGRGAGGGVSNPVCWSFPASHYKSLSVGIRSLRRCH